MITESSVLKRATYSSDISDKEWTILKPFIPRQKCTRKKGGRPFKYERREIVNAILYVLLHGCRWKDILRDFPPHGISWYYFNSWSKAKLWEKINGILRE